MKKYITKFSNPKQDFVAKALSYFASKNLKVIDAIVANSLTNSSLPKELQMQYNSVNWNFEYLITVVSDEQKRTHLKCYYNMRITEKQIEVPKASFGQNLIHSWIRGRFTNSYSNTNEIVEFKNEQIGGEFVLNSGIFPRVSNPEMQKLLRHFFTEITQNYTQNKE